MEPNAVLLDANVLYPASLRDVLLHLAQRGWFHARWTERIHSEWINALLRDEPHRERRKLERTRDLMNRAVLDSLIDQYEHLVPTLDLPDADDRHVLAAAIIGGCRTIVTKNLRDFPVLALSPYGIVARHPDDFLCEQFDFNLNDFSRVVTDIRANLTASPYTEQQHLEALRRVDIRNLVIRIESLASKNA